MWRFAAAITLTEIGLTALTAALFSFDVAPDPYVTRDDLREYGLAFESHETGRQKRFDALLGYDTRIVLLNPRQTVWVSARVGQTEVDFDARRRREQHWAEKRSSGSTLILDDPGHDDRGYLVRQRREDSAGVELVRFRGERMLVVRVWTSELSESPDEALAACERRGRLLQARMLQKLRWWSRPTADAPR